MTENTPAIKNNMPLMPSNEEFQMLQIIAKNAQDSGMYKGVGQMSSIFMVLLAARELGVSPMLALNGGIWNIQGKIEISARLMNGLIRRAGHSIKIIESNDEICTLLGTRTDGDFITLSFSKSDAEKAGLWGNNTWKKYPGDMLYNRCMSRLARRLFSDVIGNAYVEGEIKEAKEIEKKENELAQIQQAEYEEMRHNPESLQTIIIDAPKSDTMIHQPNPDISIHHIPETLQTVTMNVPHGHVHHIPDVTKMVDNVPKITQDELTLFLTHYVDTTDTFKENFEKGIFTNWNVKDFKDIPSDKVPLVMSWIAKNIEMQSMPKGN